MNNRLNKIILFSFLTLIVASCKVGQNYQRPNANLPEKFRNITTADTSSIADIEWKNFFTDPVLQKLIEKGIANNYDLQIALKNVAASQERLKQAKWLQTPELNFAVTAQTSYPSKNSLNGLSVSSFLGKDHVEDYNASFNLSWEADIWGKISRQKETALAQYLQSYEAAKAIQTQVVAAIAQDYYNLLMLDEQLSIAKQNLILSDTTLLFTNLQFKAGESNSLAVQQAEAQEKSTQLLIPQLEQSIAVQENALSILTGAMPDSISRNAKLSEVPVSAYLNAGVPAGIVSRRPDVRAQEQSLIAANAAVGIAQAQLYPQLIITASGGVNSFKASNWFQTPASLFGGVMGSLTQPILQRKQLKTNLAVAKIERDKSVLAFRQTVLNAVGEVSDALTANDKLKEQREIASQQVNTLQDGIKSARLLYKSGMANYLEVITAQENALQAELNLAFMQRQQLSAVVDLYRSLGGGWK